VGAHLRFVGSLVAAGVPLTGKQGFQPGGIFVEGPSAPARLTGFFPQKQGIGTMNRLVLVLVLEDKPPIDGEDETAVHGKPPFIFSACMGAMNLEQVRRHRQGAAGILPAVLSDWSAGKMPAAPWSSACVFSAAFPSRATIR